MAKINPDTLTLTDKVIDVRRVAKVVKGGRRFSFSAIVAVGDGTGHIGIGFGKANEVPEAIRKGIEKGKKNLIKIPIVNDTLPHEVLGHWGAGKVMLKPASKGTGLIAGTVVRAILDAAGIHNVLTKSLGSNNTHNVVKATMEGLSRLRTWEEIVQLRS
ncbi:MAG: 30S ribosomal protein S5 [bacterium]